LREQASLGFASLGFAAQNPPEPPSGPAGFLAREVARFQQLFEGLPIWLQALVVGVIVVSVYQWQRRRNR
jgi:hypothetical protein